jgi:hypothetical protein
MSPYGPRTVISIPSYSVEQHALFFFDVKQVCLQIAVFTGYVRSWGFAFVLFFYLCNNKLLTIKSLTTFMSLFFDKLNLFILK